MATHDTIKSLFGMESLHFEIPKYQRAYSWEKDQWMQFLDDLKDAESGYYLGHFLFESDGDGKYFVIDGQQRLTTCVIFISAALDILGADEKYMKDVRVWRRRFLEDPDLGPRMKPIKEFNRIAAEVRQRIKSAALEVAREKNLGEQDKNRFVCVAVAQWEPIPEEMEESV